MSKQVTQNVDKLEAFPRDDKHFARILKQSDSVGDLVGGSFHRHDFDSS